MEGAVISGKQAAEAILGSADKLNPAAQLASV
jgi:hypothetical protein